MALKDEFLTIAEAAKQLGVTRQTMHRWVLKWNIPVEKLGTQKLIKKDDLEQYNNQDIRKRIVQQLIIELRKTFQYENGDKIEEVRHSKNMEMMFYVTKKNGTTETLGVSDIDVKVNATDKGAAMTFRVTKNIKRARKNRQNKDE